MLLADITFRNAIFLTIEIFFFMILLWILFGIIGDIFRSKDMSGVIKAVWIVFLCFFPPLTMLIYLVVRGSGMADRQLEANAAAQAQFNKYIQEQAGAGGGGAADQIAKAKELLDSGAITQAEFDTIKAKALS